MHEVHHFALAVCLVLGCKEQAPAPAPTDPPKAAETPLPADSSAAPTWYRAVLTAGDGTEFPFFLQLPPPGPPGQAVIRVAEHEIRTGATFDGKHLILKLDALRSTVDATVDGDGKLVGTLTVSLKAWGDSSHALTARKVASPTASTLATVRGAGVALDLGGGRTVWRLEFADGPGKLVVTQLAAGDFHGTVSLDNGNIIYLAGNGRGDELVLTGFDGTSLFRLGLTVDAKRARATGKLLAGHRLQFTEVVTGMRVDDFTQPIKLKPTSDKFDLPQLAGLEGKPVLVELAGSWCSTCKSSAPFLVELYREYRPRGMEIVTLLYEFTNDKAYNAEQAARFKRDYGATWKVIPVDGEFEDLAEVIPRGLADLDPAGFPIALFLAADRSLVALHAGFPSPDAKADFQKVAAEYRKHIEAMLARSKKP